MEKRARAAAAAKGVKKLLDEEETFLFYRLVVGKGAAEAAQLTMDDLRTIEVFNGRWWRFDGILFKSSNYLLKFLFQQGRIRV